MFVVHVIYYSMFYIKTYFSIKTPCCILHIYIYINVSIQIYMCKCTHITYIKEMGFIIEDLSLSPISYPLLPIYDP